ncbi:hypothetical protein QJS66_04840 [Kocuria rhizophila]|nr:hypothetical protein QJS66_04840 [Kocuria rhizophila]
MPAPLEVLDDAVRALVVVRGQDPAPAARHAGPDHARERHDHHADRPGTRHRRASVGPGRRRRARTSAAPPRWRWSPCPSTTPSPARSTCAPSPRPGGTSSRPAPGSGAGRAVVEGVVVEVTVAPATAPALPRPAEGAASGSAVPCGVELLWHGRAPVPGSCRRHQAALPRGRVLPGRGSGHVSPRYEIVTPKRAAR